MIPQCKRKWNTASGIFLFSALFLGETAVLEHAHPVRLCRLCPAVRNRVCEHSQHPRSTAPAGGGLPVGHVASPVTWNVHRLRSHRQRTARLHCAGGFRHPTMGVPGQTPFLCVQYRLHLLLGDSASHVVGRDVALLNVSRCAIAIGMQRRSGHAQNRVVGSSKAAVGAHPATMASAISRSATASSATISGLPGVCF